jgi:hypothetical protein
MIFSENRRPLFRIAVSPHLHKSLSWASPALCDDPVYKMTRQLDFRFAGFPAAAD